MTGLRCAILKKAAAFAGAFFVSGLFITPVLAGECLFNKQAGKIETVQLDYVIDGDTVRLKDGRKVRIISINAPEIAREDKPGEPYGDQAKTAAEKYLKKNKQLYLQKFDQDQDNHGRTLGHIFLPDGTSFSEALLKQGLAFQVFVGEPDIYKNCLRRAEKHGRNNHKGVWSLDPVTPVSSGKLHSGFMVVSGKVKKIDRPENSRYAWLEMDGHLVLRVPAERVTTLWLNSLKHKKIEARGWVVDRSRSKRKPAKGHKRWMMLLYQTDSVEISP